MSRQVGDRWTLGRSLMGLARVLHQQGDVRQAAELYLEALVRLRELRDLWNLPWAVGGLAMLCHAEGDVLRAARQFGAMEAMREGGGTREQASWQSIFEAAEQELPVAVGGDAFARAWSEGHAMGPEVAVALGVGDGDLV